MAPSLRDLIDFLLAEIALCGSQGASPADVLSFIDTFYAKSAKNDSGRKPVVDRRFQEKVWLWLTRNPEVHVGKDREGNGLSLEEAESQQLGQGDGVEKAQDSQESPVRMFVSEKRTWLAVTGHEPDDTKVLPMEFSLLSIIASRKSAGITQPELIKLSGQDKRSVPKRTDVLQQKGYIEKRAIQIKAARTSLCTLRQFLSADKTTAESSSSGIEDGTDGFKMIDFKQFTNRLFEILREHKIIARNDLKDALGFNDHWRWRVLSRALRKFERIGNVKRVRALSQYANTMKKYHPCVMLVREPTDKDIERFHDFSIHIYSDLKQSNDAGFEDDAEAEDAAEEPSNSGNVRTMEQEEGVEVSGRVLPQWSPDRTIHNQLFEVVDRTGTNGCSNNDVIRSCFGVMWRRPLENTLARLSECWQLSQPPHLRHLALVRDTALHRTITHFVHYSARHFSKLVEAGESSWEAVEFVARSTKPGTVPVPPLDVKPQLDVYGLPLDNPRSELVKNGDCSLSDCMWVCKPRDYNCSSSDPKPLKMEDGTFSIQYGIKGHSIQSPAGRRSTPETPVRLKIEDEDILNIEPTPARTPVSRKPRKSKPAAVDLTGMSEKERLEAMGMDETWTEYSVLLIERPGPGVYVTKRGRRRPAGKERGRPPASRIAVFKTPKLRDISWFAVENGEEAASQSPAPEVVDQDTTKAATTVPTEPSNQGQNSVRGKKRSYQRRASGPGSERPSKLPRTEDVGAESTQDIVVEEGPVNGDEAESMTAESRTPSGVKGKRKRAVSPETEHQESRPVRKRGGKAAKSTEDRSQLDSSAAGENEQAPSDRSPDKADGHQPEVMPNGESALSQIANVEQRSQLPSNESHAPQPPTQSPAKDSEFRTPQRKDAPRKAERVLHATSTPAPASKQVSTPSAVNGTPASRVSATPDTSTPKSARSKLPDKGGSVGFLRRRIVMELVEKAGGAFPMGTELWYPFVTSWMKTKYKERPDMRTLRNAVKQLVDAGKLRQQTFCGKDKKGVMVTKTIICESNLGPDDPIVKDMQERILTTDTRYYIPPQVEVEPNLTKQGTTPKLSRGVKYSDMIPVEPSVTVHLQQKPAAVQALEKRKGEAYQRRLDRRLEIEKMRESMQETRPSGAVRLLSLSRPDWHAPRPRGALGREPMYGAFGLTGERRNHLLAGGIGSKQVLRSRPPVSAVTPHAMLMSPAQTFYPNNGTFSTDAGLVSRIPKRALSRADQMQVSAKLMLMSPHQSFNPNTGTFSTDSGIAALGERRSAQYRNSYYRADPHLPRSLDDQLMQAGRRNVRVPGEKDTRSGDFIRDTNAILRWELQNEKLLQQRSENVRYINQGIQGSFKSAPIEGGIHFDALPWERDIVPPVRRRRQRQDQSEFQEIQPRAGRFIFEHHPPFPAQLNPTPIDPLPMRHYPAPGPLPSSRPQHQQPQPRRIQKLNEMMAVGENSPPPSQTKPLTRRNRAPSTLTGTYYQKLMTAIVAVRALAGGSDGRIIDWALVTCCFPDFDSKTVVDKGKNLMSKHRLQVAKMQSDFQERFIEAYANNEVPPIDYDNLEGYDWDAVIEWANVNLDVPNSDMTPDLPATREQFDDIFELREEPLGTLDEIYHNMFITLNRKRMLITNMAFASPLPVRPKEHRSQRHLELSRFETLKTWVRANVFTPAEVYRSADARNALAHVDNGHLNTALQSLVTERVVSQANKGRMVPGRNYDITDFFIQTLSKRRPIEATEVRRASKFKTDTLDPAFAEQGVFGVQFGAEDGDILAIINLFSTGRINLIPRDPPRDKFGLTEGGYLTRMIEKKKLRFEVDVKPVPDKYVNGNPTASKISANPPPCPPRIPVNNVLLPEKFPLWYDIHGNVIQVLWELAVAAVLGTVAIRPGITAERLAGMIKPTMGAWEVRMVLEWLLEVGVVARRNGDADAQSDKCWFVLEWWWMVL